MLSGEPLLFMIGSHASRGQVGVVSRRAVKQSGWKILTQEEFELTRWSRKIAMHDLSSCKISCYLPAIRLLLAGLPHILALSPSLTLILVNK